MGKEGEKNKIPPYFESSRRSKVKNCLVQYLGIDVLMPINFAYDGMDLAINLMSLGQNYIYCRYKRMAGRWLYPLVSVLRSAPPLDIV
jgi:hypothetical protein